MSDSSKYDINFECPRCLPGLGNFTLRVSNAEQQALSPEYMPYRCPRGHKVTWTCYRGFYRVGESEKVTVFDPLDLEYWGPSKEKL